MGTIADAYDTMRVVGRSPDGSVTLTLTGHGRLEVELDPAVRATHTETELARQIAGAARITIAAFQQQQARAIAQAVEEARAAG